MVARGRRAARLLRRTAIGFLFDSAKAAVPAFIFAQAYPGTEGTGISSSLKVDREYLAYCFVIITLIYPVVVHWVWSSGGWLSVNHPKPLFGVGMIDFAGSGVVHMTGGTTALIAAIILGPRRDRGEKPEPINPSSSGHTTTPLQGQSATLTVLGAFILWVGFYGFNLGSTLGITGNLGTTVQLVVRTTTMGAVGGAIGDILWSVPRGRFDVGQTCNSIIGGLIGIAAGCATVQVHTAATDSNIVSRALTHDPPRNTNTHLNTDTSTHLLWNTTTPTTSEPRSPLCCMCMCMCMHM